VLLKEEALPARSPVIQNARSAISLTLNFSTSAVVGRLVGSGFLVSGRDGSKLARDRLHFQNFEISDFDSGEGKVRHDDELRGQ
jgi:hypothetical protein